MKKFLKTIFVLSIITLTGCTPKTEILTCTMEKEDSGFNDNSTINLTYTDNSLISLTMNTTLELIEESENESLSDIKEIFDMVYEDISLNEGINITAELENENILINVEIDYQTSSEEGQSRVSGTIIPEEAFNKEQDIKNMKTDLETAGYTCSIEEEE